MKKLLFTAICAMAFTNGFASNDVKEVIEEQVVYFGGHDECAELIFKDRFIVGESAFLLTLQYYFECRNSTDLDEIVIDVEAKKP